MLFENDQYATDENSPNHSISQRQVKYSRIKQEKAQLQIQIMKLKSQLKRIDSNYKDQLQHLRQQTHLKTQTLSDLEDIILRLKQELNSAQGQNIRAFQQNQKLKRQMQKLKMDNETMQMEIQKFRSQRRLYCSKIEEFKCLKNETTDRLADRDKHYQQTLRQKKNLERLVQQYKITIQQLSQQLNEREKQVRQLSTEIQSSLQAQFSSSSLASNLQKKLADFDEQNKRLEEHVLELQKERQYLSTKLEQFQSQRYDNKSRYGGSDTATTILQIGSLWKQIQHVLDDKKNRQDKNHHMMKKLKCSMQCLDDIISN